MSAYYDSFLELLSKADIDLEADTLKVRFVRASAYTYSAAHNFLDDLPAAIGTDQTLANKVFSAGTMNADDVTFTGIAASADIDGLVIYKDTGSAATSPLVCHINGFTVTPDGNDIVVQWANVSPFILKV